MLNLENEIKKIDAQIADLESSLKKFKYNRDSATNKVKKAIWAKSCNFVSADLIRLRAKRAQLKQKQYGNIEQ